MLSRTILISAARSPKWDHMRDEQLHSLLDGRAKHPDGTPREIGIPLWERMEQQRKAQQEPPA